MYRYLAIIVGGQPRHGKSTTASFLSSETGMLHGNTSDVIYRSLAQKMHRDEEEVRSMSKESLRPELIKMGDSLCHEDPAFLVKSLLDQHIQIITGVRKPLELAAVRKHTPRLKFLWVKRPGFHVIEDNTILTAADADHIIINDGTLDSLLLKVREFARDMASGRIEGGLSSIR